MNILDVRKGVKKSSVWNWMQRLDGPLHYLKSAQKYHCHSIQVVKSWKTESSMFSLIARIYWKNRDTGSKQIQFLMKKKTICLFFFFFPFGVCFFLISFPSFPLLPGNLESSSAFKRIRMTFASQRWSWGGVSGKEPDQN